MIAIFFLYKYTNRQGFYLDKSTVCMQVTTAGDCNPKKNPSHKIDGKYPILYLLQGHANDGGCWLNYTSVSRYAEEHRIAVCMVSTANVCYMNAPAYGENYYDLVHKEIPELLKFIEWLPRNDAYAGMELRGI